MLHLLVIFVFFVAKFWRGQAKQSRAATGCRSQPRNGRTSAVPLGPLRTSMSTWRVRENQIWWKRSPARRLFCKKNSVTGLGGGTWSSKARWRNLWVPRSDRSQFSRPRSGWTLLGSCL